MAWWQKKLLRYALSRTGLLDDTALDLDNLDVTLGKKNVVELKDVGLNIKRISKLAQLPPSLRVETARVVSLRLTVPADIYQSSIVAEVDGVVLDLKLDAIKHEPKRQKKVHRRLHSPPPYDPGGLDDSQELRIPTTEELAKSFLLDEPAQERKELEATIAADSKGLEDSIVSESSEGDDNGTGTGVGLPSFLAAFLQGIVDRLQVNIKNVEARFETELSEESGSDIPVTLQLRVGAAELADAAKDHGTGTFVDQQHPGQRQIKLQDLSVSILSDADIFAELSELPSQASVAESRRQEHDSTTEQSDLSRDSTMSPRSGTSPSPPHKSSSFAGRASPEAMRASIMTADADRFADAGDEHFVPTLHASHSDLDIQAGDDNLSWASRRRKTEVPAEDLWASMRSDDHLPESLLIDRASTPRVHSSRGQSPGATRARRDVSPYARSLHSPGSWPTMEEGPQRHRIQQSPGSWPTMEQSHQSMFQSLTPGPAAGLEDPMTDNKRTALEVSTVETHQEPEPSVPYLDNDYHDLSVSRVFSHEEAESIYMSAMTDSPSMHVPGGWASGAQSHQAYSQDTRTVGTSFAAMKHTETVEQADDDDLAYGEQPYRTPVPPLSGNVTPRATSPKPASAPPGLVSEPREKAEKHLMHVDTVSVWLPSTEGSSSQQGPVAERIQPSVSASFAPHSMPGAFSTYSEAASSRRRHGTSSKEEASGVIWAPQKDAQVVNTAPALDVGVGQVNCQIDIPCARLLQRIGLKAVVLLNNPKAATDTAESAQSTAFALSVQKLSLCVMESINNPLGTGSPLELSSKALLTLEAGVVALASMPEETKIQIGTCKAFLGASCLLSFDRSRDMRSSMIIPDHTPDIALVVTKRAMISKRPVTDVSLETLSAILSLDIGVFDEVFGSFGGLSGILEVSSSIMSESGVGSSHSSPSKPSKGVHFEADLQYAEATPELKVNGRVGGVQVTLQGSTCGIRLRTTTVKAVYREQAAVATVEQILLTGPHLTGRDDDPSLSADLSTVRVEYLVSPQDKDLERLLSLLTPSKDKYDSDDDILLDTLMRQRRKGAVARVSVAGAKTNCLDWLSLSSLEKLGDELGKLSAVAKYLPEDERPGLLTLVRVKDCEASLPVNERFGHLRLNLSDFHCAHVGLPALLALSLGDVTAAGDSEVKVLHKLLSTNGSENLPVAMARMLGGEEEPTVKIKLFNICVEYSVPVILALTSSDEAANTQEIVSDLARSVANLAWPDQKDIGTNVAGPASDAPGLPAKRTKIDILVHDSAIGLTPQELESKVLLLLTDAKLATMMPPEQSLKADLEVRKAGIFIADKIVSSDAGPAEIMRGTPGNSATKERLTAALSKQGFVSVGSVLTATVTFSIQDPTDSQSKSVEIDVRNELFLLETCADSTQTLIATLNALAPPTPPSKQPKYLTEPMTIEDMMASFTGDAFAKPEQPPQTLFDVEEEEPEDDPDLMLDMAIDLPSDDGLLADSEMTSSLYGPVSGILGGVDQPDDDDPSEDFGETVESLLEDDPFEMPSSPTEARLSDSVLARELNKQFRAAVNDESVDLGLYEEEDLGFDALGGTHRALGTQHRFNTPAATRRKAPAASAQIAIPFKLRLRNLHVIWNIYDGYDWQRTRSGITEAVEQMETRAEERKARRRRSHNDPEDEDSVIGDFLFNSIYIGVPSNHDAQELRRQINRNIDDLVSETESVPMSGLSRPTTAYSASGRPIRQRQRRRLKLERSKAHKVAFELKGVSADVLVFPPDSAKVVSSVDVRVKDFEIFDNVPTSTWRKFLTQLENDPSLREVAKPMFHIELLNVRTLENFAASEIVLHVSVLPLRLHVDQDALDFITRFFEFKDESTTGASSPSDQPFLQRIEVDTVDLCLDYKPKKVDYVGLRSGHTTEFMNFVILDAANIRLKHAIVYGIKGFEPLHKTLNDIWMPDVQRNQLPTVLAGLAPARSLVNIGSGVRDVVAIPIREYKKDGRIVRSIQKGAFSFGKTTASELARLGAKVAIGTQHVLQGAEGLLSPASASPSGRPGSSRRRSSDQGWQGAESDDEEQEPRAISAYANQPLGVLSGLRSAQKHLEHDLLTARDALIAVQGEVLESSSPGDVAAAVARHAPTVILRPIIGTSRAVGTALLGVGNQIDRANVRRIEDVSAALECYDVERC